MTQEQFDNHAWRKSDKVLHETVELEVLGVDFENRIVFTAIGWVEYSEIELVKEEGK